MSKEKRLILFVSTVGIEDNLGIIHDMRIGYGANVFDLRKGCLPEIPTPQHCTGRSGWLRDINTETLHTLIHGESNIIVLHNHWTWIYYTNFIDWLVEKTGGHVIPVEDVESNLTSRHQIIERTTLQQYCAAWDKEDSIC